MESISEFQRKLQSGNESRALRSGSSSKLGTFLGQILSEVSEYICDGLSTEDCGNIGNSDVFKKLMDAHSRASQFVSQLMSQFCVTNVDNCVVCNVICDEFLYLCAELFESMKQAEFKLRGHINNLGVFQSVGNVARMHGALKEELLSCKQFAASGRPAAAGSVTTQSVSLSAYQKYAESNLFNQYQDTFQTEIAELRQVLGDFVRSRSPLDFNPYRDAIFATTAGGKFNAQERAVTLQYLDQSGSTQAKQMFQQVAEQHGLNPNSTSEELMLYFLYQNKRIDLTGALTCAIDHVVDRTIDKHLDQPASYFVGQMLVFTSITIPGAGAVGAAGRGFTGEIIECKKQNNSDLIMTVRDIQGRNFTARLQSGNQRGGLNVDLLYHVTRELGKYLIDSTSSVDQFDIGLRPGQTPGDAGVPDFIPSGHYLARRCHKVQGSTSLYSSIVKALTFSYGRDTQVVHELTCVTKDRNSSKTVQLTVTHREKTFLLSKSQDTYRGMSCTHSAMQTKSVYIGYLDKYQVEYKSNMLTGLEVPTTQILLKKKRVDPNELRFRKMEEMQRLKSNISACFKEPELRVHLNAAVLRLVQSDLLFSLANLSQLNGWLTGLPTNLGGLFNALVTVCIELSVDHFAVITELVYEAVMLNLLDCRTMSLAALDIMSRLTVAHEYLKDLAGRDLILFVGETGAGKSTTLNYFAGNKLVVNDSGPVRVVNVDPSDSQSAVCAVIGSSLISSETTFVRGFRVLARERRFWQTNTKGLIDFEDLLMCDLPGFHDTRGQGYDLSAALSIARAVKRARSIKGIVLVIPFGSVFLERGNVFIDAFANLEEMFVDGFAGLSAEETSSIHLVISQSRDPDSDKLKFSQMIDEFCAETQAILARSQGFDETVLKRLQIWEMVQNIQMNNRLVFINVCNPFQRTQFLAACAASSAQCQMPKSKFTEVFERGTHQKAFSDCLQRSLSIWHKLLLQRYLEDIPLSLEKCRTLQQKKEVEANELLESSRCLAASTATRRESILNHRHRLFQLNSLSGGSESVGEDLRDELATVENEGLNAKINETRELGERIDTLAEQLAAKNHAANVSANALRAVELQVRIAQARVAQLSAGNVVQILYERDAHTHDSILTLSAVKSGAREAAHAEVRALTTADYVPGSTTTHRRGSFKGDVWVHVFIAKEYRLAPQVNAEQMETFYNSGRVDVRGADGANRYWVASVRGHNCKILDEPGLRPKAAPGGKSMVYTIEMTYEGGNRPLPWFRIEHNMPSIDMNYAEIEDEQDTITMLRRTVGANQRELAALQTELGEMTEELDTLREKKFNADLSVSTLEVEQFKDNVPKLIDNYEALITQQEIEIECNGIAMTSNANKLLACEENNKDCAAEVTRLETEKICLALVIKRNLHMARCVKEFAEEACDLGSDTAIALQKRAVLSKGALGLLRMQCAEYISYFEHHFDSLTTRCDADLHVANPKLVLLTTTEAGGRIDGLRDLADDTADALDESVVADEDVMQVEDDKPNVSDFSRHAVVCRMLQNDWDSLPIVLTAQEEELESVVGVLDVIPPEVHGDFAIAAGAKAHEMLVDGASERGYNCYPVAGVGNSFVSALIHQVKFSLNQMDVGDVQTLSAELAEELVQFDEMPPLSALYAIIDSCEASPDQLILFAAAKVTNASVVVVNGKDIVGMAAHPVSSGVIVLGREVNEVTGAIQYWSLIPVPGDARHQELRDAVQKNFKIVLPVQPQNPEDEGAVKQEEEVPGITAPTEPVKVEDHKTAIAASESADESMAVVTEEAKSTDAAAAAADGGKWVSEDYWVAV